MLKIAILDSGVDSCKKGITISRGEDGTLSYLDSGYDFDVLMHGDVIDQALSDIENVEVYSVKIFQNKLYTTAETLCAAIDWCINSDINIINISIGIEPEDKREADVITNICKKAYDNNIVIVSTYNERFCYPAVLDTVIGVNVDYNLLPGEYQIDHEGLFLASGIVGYVDKVNKARGGIGDNSFACARLTKIILELFCDEEKIDYDTVVAKLNNYMNFGAQSDLKNLNIGISGLMFVNNTNAHYLCDPQIVNYNIKYLFNATTFYKGNLEHNYKIINFELSDIFYSTEKVNNLFKDIDTVVIPNQEFLKNKVDDLESKTIDFLLSLAKCKKNVVYLGKIQHVLVDKLSTEFRKNGRFIYFTNEVSSNIGTNVNMEAVNRTLLISVSRIVDSILLECSIKRKYGKECLILSNNYNSQLIGSRTICEMYNDQFYWFKDKKQTLDWNIENGLKSSEIKDVYLSIDYPILQFNMDDNRNENYLKFLFTVLAYNPDDIIVIANQQDDVLDIEAAIHTIETVASKKINTVVFSSVSYCDGDNYGYEKYSYLPGNREKLAVKMKELSSLLPDIEISEILNI